MNTFDQFSFSQFEIPDIAILNMARIASNQKHMSGLTKIGNKRQFLEVWQRLFNLKRPLKAGNSEKNMWYMQNLEYLYQQQERYIYDEMPPREEAHQIQRIRFNEYANSNST